MKRPIAEKFSASNEETVRLIDTYPLAWIVAGAGTEAKASLLPLRAVVADDGRITALMGHCARANEVVTALRANPAAVVLFLGPHGYISPSWMRDRTQAPTWNYASARFAVRITLVDDARALRDHLDDLVQAMERKIGGRWSVADMGPRFESLAERIVAFRADVVSHHVKFKLGQDERDDVFDDILAALAAGDDRALLDLMTAFNRNRAGREGD